MTNRLNVSSGAISTERGFNIKKYIGTSKDREQLGEILQWVEETKNNIIEEILSQLGIDEYLDIHYGKRFPKFVMENNSDNNPLIISNIPYEEVLWFNDGSDNGTKIVTFNTNIAEEHKDGFHYHKATIKWSV